jgi:hypothetical protein
MCIQYKYQAIPSRITAHSGPTSYRCRHARGCRPRATPPATYAVCVREFVLGDSRRYLVASLEIFRLVDRPNFGICLDTFNIVGRGWADPVSSDRKVTNADAALDTSIKRPVDTVDVEKVFYIVLQLVDAEKLEAPLNKNHPYYVEGQPARMSWSRNARCFMYETDRGAYLPVEKAARAKGLTYSGRRHKAERFWERGEGGMCMRCCGRDHFG